VSKIADSQSPIAEKSKAKPGDELRVAAEIVDILAPFKRKDQIRILRAAAIMAGGPDPLPGGEQLYE
jgi:hypothetical protein